MVLLAATPAFCVPAHALLRWRRVQRLPPAEGCASRGAAPDSSPARVPISSASCLPASPYIPLEAARLRHASGRDPPARPPLEGTVSSPALSVSGPHRESSLRCTTLKATAVRANAGVG